MYRKQPIKNVSVQKYKKALRSAYGKQQGNALRRTNCLTWMICGLIKSGKSHLNEIASGLPHSTDLESRVKKIKRWLLSDYNDWSVHFVPCLSFILQAFISKDREMVFAIDGSDLGNGCTALMISLVWGKRAIPICWLVRQGRKGHLPASMHLDLFKKLHTLLEGYSKVVVLGDGEFDNHQVIAACEQWEWKFVFRTSKNTKIFDDQETYSINALAPPANELYQFVSNVAYTNERHGPLNALCWHDHKWDKQHYLLTNFELAQEAACYYRKRWSIETLFGDIKSRGFYTHKLKLSDPQRITKLLIVVCLAYILLFQLGNEEKKSPYLPKVTRKDRCDLSIFTIGKKLVDYCLKQAIPIIFSFSKNSCIQYRLKSVR